MEFAETLLIVMATILSFLEILAMAVVIAVAIYLHRLLTNIHPIVDALIRSI